MKKIKTLNKIISPVGIEIKKINSSDLFRRIKLLKEFKINKILDVGGNVGNYALELREKGFKGEIISFEPLHETYKVLNKKANKDKKWITKNVALGSKNEKRSINIAGNIASSSLLDMLPAHINSAPQTKYIDKEVISVITLDSVFGEIYEKNDKIYMKIDTQGFEKEVLEGAIQSLYKIVGLQIELSIIPLYKNSVTYLEMIDYLQKKGYKLYSIENGFSDPNTGRLLQFDGIFFRP